MAAKKKAPAKKKAAAKKKAPAKKAAPKKTGRPTLFSPQLTKDLCERLIRVGSLRKVCEDDDMPCKTTVFSWLLKAEQKGAEEEYVSFLNQYVRARELSKDYRFDELQHELNEVATIPLLSDDGKPIMVDGKPLYTVSSQSVQLARLHFDAFKWQSEKENPKKYGPKVDLNHGGQADNPLLLLARKMQGGALLPGKQANDMGGAIIPGEAEVINE